MNLNKLTVWIVGLVIGAVLFSGLLYPVISSAAAAEETLTNEGYYDMSKYGPDDSITLTWNYSNPTVFNVNGEAIEFNNTTGVDVSIMLGELFVVRANATGVACQFYGSGTYVAANSTNPELNVIYEGGQITATNGITTKQIAGVEKIYCIDDVGNYVMKKSNKIAYLKETDEYFGTGMTYFGSQVLLARVYGTVNNPTVVGPGYTITNTVVNYAEDSTHKDTVELSNITFDATNSAELTKEVVYSYLVVPKEITVEKTIHVDGTQASLLMVIPLMVLVGIIVYAASLMRSKY